MKKRNCIETNCIMVKLSGLEMAQKSRYNYIE